MSFGKIIADDMPCWYLWVGGIFCLYHASRDIIEKWAEEKVNNNDNRRHWHSWNSKWAKIYVWYIHDFLFKFIVVASGFIALYAANMLLSSVTSFDNIGSGTAVLIIFLFVWGIIGISGYLTYLIVIGKISPGK